MSTKSGITSGPGFYLYHELMERSDDVYLRLDSAEFEAYPDQVIVRIPIHVWEHIRHHGGGFSPQYHALSDAELAAHCEREVDERIQEWQAAPERSKGLLAFCGSMVYGSAADPREEQIAAGMAYLSQVREKEREIVQRIKDLAEYAKR